MADDVISGPLGDDGTRLPFSVEDVPWEEYSHGERFGTRFRQLGEFGGCSHVGVSMEEIAPGRQTYPAHYHLLEEEHLLVLEGHPTLRLGDQTHDLGPGSYVCFPAGQKAGHTLVNHTEETVRYLIIGERNPNEVTVHTDTGRVGYGSSAGVTVWPTRWTTGTGKATDLREVAAVMAAADASRPA